MSSDLSMYTHQLAEHRNFIQTRTKEKLCWKIFPIPRVYTTNCELVLEGQTVNKEVCAMTSFVVLYNTTKKK